MSTHMIQRKIQINVSSTLQVYLASTLLVFLTATGWRSEVRAVSADTETPTMAVGPNPIGMCRTTDRGLAIPSRDQVLNAVQSGGYGHIIACMELPNENPIKVVGIPWMIPGSASQVAIIPSLSQNFAGLHTSASTETNGAKLEPQAAVCVVEVVANILDSGPTLTQAVTSETARTTYSRDFITAMTEGNLSSLIDDFYFTHISGRSVVNVTPPLHTMDIEVTPALDAGLQALHPTKK